MSSQETRVVDPLIRLKQLHHFLAGQVFYPILLSSLLAMILFSARAIQTHSLAHINLVWNLFLAWIPYLFSLLAAHLDSAYPRRWGLLLVPGFIWLIFFPNAPYLLTNFLQLHGHRGVPLWYDIGLLVSFVWTGLILAIASLRTMQSLVQQYLGWIAGWLFASSAILLGGLGVFLGRFSRWNSWDLILQPQAIFADLLNRFIDPFDNVSFFAFTFMYTAFLFICYYTFISIRQITPGPGRRKAS
jgi:uncharacterized membrane protein